MSCYCNVMTMSCYYCNVMTMSCYCNVMIMSCYFNEKFQYKCSLYDKNYNCDLIAHLLQVW